MKRGRRAVFVIAVLLASSWLGQPAGHAQSGARRFTTIDALRRFSSYFHLQNVILRGEFGEGGTHVVLRGGENEIRVIFGEGASATGGPVEVRAQMIDVGRLTPTDPRLLRYENRPDPDHWPSPGEELVLNVASVLPAEPTPTPTIRALAVEPWKFEGQSVSVTGQFGGRNLFGDLPAAPAKDKYDFVLRGTEGAVWVTGLRPKGKNFDLNVDARVDTSHWLQVTGALKRERGLVMLEARTITSTSAPATRVVVEAPPPAPKEPGEIVFSSPVEGETGVSPAAPIRIQFSRGIDPPTINGQIRIGYVGGTGAAADAPAAAIDVQVTYDAASHAVLLRLAKPLEPFRTVKVELLEGAKTFDGAPITPWNVTFSVGAN